MDQVTTSADLDEFILCQLTDRMEQARTAVTRIRYTDLVSTDLDAGITASEWDTAVERLIDAGKILVYKINDLPDTLPLISYNQSGYTTPEHLLGLLKQARTDQAEEISDYLEFQGVAVPAAKIRTAVTAAQKKRIDNAVRNLNKVRAEVADRNPDRRVAWYLDGTQNFCLMVEPERQMEPDQLYIAHHVRLSASGGGDW